MVALPQQKHTMKVEIIKGSSCLVDDVMIERITNDRDKINKFLESLPRFLSVWGIEPTEDAQRGILTKGVEYIKEQRETAIREGLKNLPLSPSDVDGMVQRSIDCIPQECYDAFNEWNSTLRSVALPIMPKEYIFEDGCLMVKESYLKRAADLYTHTISEEEGTLLSMLKDVIQKVRDIQDKGVFLGSVLAPVYDANGGKRFEQTQGVLETLVNRKDDEGWVIPDDAELLNAVINLRTASRYTN